MRMNFLISSWWLLWLITNVIGSTKGDVVDYWKAECAIPFWVVSEPEQLLLSINRISCTGSFLKKKGIAQTAFLVYNMVIYKAVRTK